MLHVVLHVYVARPENFETEWTEQLFRVLVDTSEVCLQVGEEGRPVVAHLWSRMNAELASAFHFPGNTT